MSLANFNCGCIQVMAALLRDMKTGARKQLDQEVDRAVIAVPTYFNIAQRVAVKQAGLSVYLHPQKPVPRAKSSIALGFVLRTGFCGNT